MEWHDAAAWSDLPESRPVGVRVGVTRLVLVRRGDEVHAVDALCPHKFTALAEGTVEGRLLGCPMHDAHFDLATGIPRASDLWAGVLKVHPARVVDGRVQVSL